MIFPFPFLDEGLLTELINLSCINEGCEQETEDSYFEEDFS